MISNRTLTEIDRGMIIVDALLALSLSVLFIAIIASSSLTARQIFDSAQIRSVLLDAYQSHIADFNGMMPYESRSNVYGPTGNGPENDSNASSSALADDQSATTSIVVAAKWYGNDRIETDITVGYADANGSLATDSPAIAFVQVRSYPFLNQSDPAGTPLCSPDFDSNDQVGSYRYSQANGIAYIEGHAGYSTTSPASAAGSSIAIIAPIITPITLPINPLLPLTDIIVRDGIAYISTDSNISSDPDLLVADIHDAKHPLLLSSLNTGPGIAAIALSGNHIFAAADSTAAQLHVIRLNGLASLTLAKKYKLPLPQASTSPPVGVSIFYDKGMVYLGTNKWDGQEFSTIDVSSPENPVKVGGFETGTQINSIFVRNGVAYVADADQSQLRVLDISDRTNPKLAYSFSPSGWQRQEGKSIVSFEDALQFGRDSGGYDVLTDYELFSWPAIPSLPMTGMFGTPGVPTSSPVYSKDIPGGIYGIIADRNHVFAVTRTNGQEFAIFGRALASSTASYYQLPVAPQTVTCDEDRLYILSHTAPVIYEVSF